jgi:ribosomal-protein-alanine N-acetyltransferase
MAVFQTIRNFLKPAEYYEPGVVIPAPPTEYSIRPLTMSHLHEVLRLNVRCFRNGENYTKQTFSYLLNETRTLSYRAVTAEGDIAGFIFVMVNDKGSGHLTTIGVAPEHRRRGLARRMISHVEAALKARNINTIILEVRISNTDAQELYRRMGYSSVQRIENYYVNGEACFLMMKSLV